jgi:hypothetical protein
MIDGDQIYDADPLLSAGEGRDNAASEIRARDLSDGQKRKIPYANTVSLCGEP